MHSTSVMIGVLFAVSLGTAQNPITQKESCKRFMPAVVRIDVADGKATGFIISPDGWILTAAHVVLDPETGERRSAVAVSLPDGTSPLAEVFIDKDSVIRDFALLKVDAKSLPFLQLGTNDEVSPVSDVTIIGYPFAAESKYSTSINTKFCLSGMVAAADTVADHGVNVDAVFFQGPAIKGISGGPVISRDTGHVIGIQSQRLAGIGQGLGAVRSVLQNGPAPGVQVNFSFAGVNLGPTIIELINVLDRHLANGLGAATGADDAAIAFRGAKKAYKQQQRH